MPSTFYEDGYKTGRNVLKEYFVMNAKKMDQP